ncbi:hypothetical protein SAMN02745136_02435 [Anaerocolumna jejuensis DSM 15929]|uniref:YqbQ/XkdQ domain-containing protein n=1 Tax=Anaerocolumna jejuensis DSM 15929 TaxID=1121322 RepID=A0A1M6S794_9FIRM|nr:hypothetical protein [Anaerocolumna jejuensis]SHK40550.1 hypothetical protein SAMN02745136_02435 [Anaerocolumna jejuensis DSM 15929]
MISFIVKTGEQIYDISELVTKVSFQDTLNEGCSKLDFTYLKKDLDIKNGSIVRFTYDSVGIFEGFVFKISRGRNQEISITAYDQLRYCKAKDTLFLKNDTAATLTNKMCNYFHLKKGSIAEAGFVLPMGVQEDKTWLDIIYSAISDTLKAKGKWYALRDEFGKITLREIGDLALNLVLGDASLCYDYKYEKSIDNDFYNMIKLVRVDDETEKADVTVVKDDKSIYSYGFLQYFEKVDKKYTSAEVKAMADSLLGLYNREAESVSLECLGNTKVRAGTTFNAIIKDIGLDKRLIVKSVTHQFLPLHTMSLEVMI